MYADVEKIKMLEVLETPEVVEHKDGNDFAVGHFVTAITAFLPSGFGNFLCDLISSEYSLQKSSVIQKISVILSLVSKFINIRILLLFRYKDMKYLLAYQIFNVIS